MRLWSVVQKRDHAQFRIMRSALLSTSDKLPHRHGRIVEGDSTRPVNSLGTGRHWLALTSRYQSIPIVRRVVLSYDGRGVPGERSKPQALIDSKAG
jgi:hypothetical protein